MPIGPAAKARDAMAALTEAGVDRFYMQHFGPFEHDLMEDMLDSLRG